MSVFKACDIRGRYPDEIDEGSYRRIGRAMGTLLRGEAPAPAVVVAGDVRRSTPACLDALVDGLLATGSRVTDLGIVPTPVAYFAAGRLRPDGLAIVTASHNPPAYNGLKLCLGPMPITLEQMDRVERTAASGPFAAGRGARASLDILADYGSFLASTARPGRGLRVVLDCGNGTQSEIAPRVLRRAGCDVVELFCTPDGTFPNRSPDPGLPGSLDALCRTVRSCGAACGLALDGDGDRLAIVDDAGRCLTGDQAIILLARHTLGSGGAGEKVVCDLKCSRAVLDVVAACGAEPLLERSGHTFIKTRMIQEQARFGGELSGHFFYRELDGGDDGLWSALRVAELAAASTQPLSALVDAMPRYRITPDVRVPYDAPDGEERLERLTAAATGDVLRLDGVRVSYPDGWGLARVSVTEPLLTFRFEAYEGSPRRIAERFLAPDPALLRLVLEHLGPDKEEPQ